MTDQTITDQLVTLAQEKDRLLVELFRIEGQMQAFVRMAEMLKEDVKGD